MADRPPLPGPRAGADFACLALGEVLLRLSPPGGRRLEETETLEVHVGGAEFNLVHALARLGLPAAWAGALPEGHPLAARVRREAAAAGLRLFTDPSIRYDGFGREGRLGLHFVDPGFGPRPARGWYDRAGTGTGRPGASGPAPWEEILAAGRTAGVHCGGTYAGLGESARQEARAFLGAARRGGAWVSWDFNWRSRMWSHEEALAFHRSILPEIRLLAAGPRDLEAWTGSSDPAEAGRRLAAESGELAALAVPLRENLPDGRQRFGACLWLAAEDRLLEAPPLEFAVLDRIGAGDAFLAGLLYGLLVERPPEEALALGQRLSALAQSRPGDLAAVDRDELLAGSGLEPRR